jgi:hypothetical protein
MLHSSARTAEGILIGRVIICYQTGPLDALTTKSPDSCGPFPGTPAEKHVMESELFGVIQIEN